MQSATDAMDRLAIRLVDGREALVRPASVADAEGIQAFVRRLTPESRRRRFLGALSELTPMQLQRLVAPAGPDDASLLALADGGGVVAMAQCAIDDAAAAEFAIVVADDWQGSGLGAQLVRALARHAHSRGAGTLGAQVMWDNEPMLALAKRLGFALGRDPDPTLVRIERTLASAARHGPTSAGTVPVFTHERMASTVGRSMPTYPWAV